MNKNFDTGANFEGVGGGNTTSPPAARVRYACFTLNNYKLEDIKDLELKLSDGRYVFQEETGKNGTPHLQGFVAYKNARSFSSLKKINGRIHWEVARNIEAAKNYCFKSDSRTGEVFSNFDYENELEKSDTGDTGKKGLKNKKLFEEAKKLDIWQNNFLRTMSEEFIKDLDALDLGGGYHASMVGPLD